jgi:hypothetical protein
MAKAGEVGRHEGPQFVDDVGEKIAPGQARRRWRRCGRGYGGMWFGGHGDSGVATAVGVYRTVRTAGWQRRDGEPTFPSPGAEDAGLSR